MKGLLERIFHLNYVKNPKWYRGLYRQLLQLFPDVSQNLQA